MNIINPVIRDNTSSTKTKNHQTSNQKSPTANPQIDSLTSTTAAAAIATLSSPNQQEVQKANERKFQKMAVIDFRTRIDYWATLGRIPETLQMFQEGLYTGILPNLVLCNILIKAYVKAYDPNSAYALLVRMSHENIHPDIISFNTMIGGYVKAKKTLEAHSVFHEMRLAGVEPDVVTFNILIGAYAKMGNAQVALDLYNSMIDAGVKPDVVSNSILIDIYVMQDRFENAKELYLKVNFNQEKSTNCVYLNEPFSLGAGFIKILLFLDRSDREETFYVLVGRNDGEVENNYQVIYRYMWEKLEYYFPLIEKAISIESIEGNDKSFTVTVPLSEPA
jgi:pentatricopeptide repeat protein